MKHISHNPNLNALSHTNLLTKPKQYLLNVNLFIRIYTLATVAKLSPLIFYANIFGLLAIISRIRWLRYIIGEAFNFGTLLCSIRESLNWAPRFELFVSKIIEGKYPSIFINGHVTQFLIKNISLNGETC